MTQKHILSLLVSAALLCGLLAGCSNTNGDASHASSSASEPSSVSSESAPSSTAQADTSGLFNKDFDENSLFSVDGTAAAFEPSLGWGPGVSGCSLKSVQAAATLLVWADEANLSARTETAIEDAYTQWYDNLSDSEQEGFAEAWPMIKDDAAALLDAWGMKDRDEPYFFVIGPDGKRKHMEKGTYDVDKLDALEEALEN